MDKVPWKILYPSNISKRFRDDSIVARIDGSVEVMAIPVSYQLDGRLTTTDRRFWGSYLESVQSKRQVGLAAVYGYGSRCLCAGHCPLLSLTSIEVTKFKEAPNLREVR